MRTRLLQIEDALADTLKYRCGGLCDIVVNEAGDRVARIYDPNLESRNGGWEIVVALNLADAAADIERALS
ncbi:MAG: hypothetical protein M9955_13345 [Rhizobiaceae bacterium]|nr:hypothetical protein [Rhizobiaceae bacterium]